MSPQSIVIGVAVAALIAVAAIVYVMSTRARRFQLGLRTLARWIAILALIIAVWWAYGSLMSWGQRDAIRQSIEQGRIPPEPID